MSDSESLLDDAEDIAYPGDAPEEETEEQPTAAAEESPEEEEATTDVAPSDPGDPDDDSDPLSKLPEEYRSYAEEHARRSVGKVQSSWQEKLDNAAELRKQAEIVEQFDAAFENDPHAVIESLRSRIPEQAEKPADPGEMPDPTMDPEGWNAWYERDKAATVAATEARYQKELDGIKGTLGADAARREASAFRQAHNLDDDEWSEYQAELQRLQNKEYALKTVVERVRLRKGKTAKKKQTAADVREAARGMEEKPGLPATGARAKPASTGNISKDVLNELEAEGVKIPDDL